MASQHPSRRQTLAGLGAASLLPACGATPTPGSGPDTRDLPALLREHVDVVVIIMLENRSFDHMLGARSLNEGDAELDGLTAQMSNPHPDGYEVFPFESTVDCVADPPHSWTSSHNQFNNGLNDGFVAEYAGGTSSPEEAMGYHGRGMLPTLNALADNYVVCDRWFCSLMSSTWPNRFYSHSATSGGQMGNDLPSIPIPSIYTKLNEADVDWGCYYGNVPVILLVPDRAITDPQIQPIESFFDQAAAGTLPKVCVVEPLWGYNSDHPPEHPLAGEIFLASVYQALAQSPQWERCVLLITYDEHGGFFDHVPPPTAPDDHAAEGFDQLGFRVPGLVIGPWVKPNHVSHEVYDHTSMLALQELIYNIEPLTLRDAAANPLLDCFDEAALREGVGHAPVSLPTIEATEESLWRPDCVSVDGLPISASSGPSPVPLGQPELEAYADEHLRGTRFDRRAQGDQIYQHLLGLAEELGVLRRS